MQKARCGRAGGGGRWAGTGGGKDTGLANSRKLARSASPAARRTSARTAGAPASASIAVTGARARTPDHCIRSTCKDCGGAGICQHNRRRSECRDCGESICQHNRIRRTCKDCGCASNCEHNRITTGAASVTSAAPACAPTASSGVSAKTARSSAATHDSTVVQHAPTAISVDG
jgi:hypothetical protein